MEIILNQLFPFVDFLYILQLEEYNSAKYFHWISSRLFKRNFQKVDSIKWTTKAKILITISLILYPILLLILVSPIPNILWLLLSLVIITSGIPLIILLANLIFLPVDNALKNRTIYSAKSKLSTMTNLKIIAIAGSYGKTSTRSFLNQIINKSIKTQTPDENHNTLYSISQDIINNLKPDTEVYIVELGEYYPGDFTKFISLLNPSYIVITSVGPQHLHTFKTQDNLDKEFSTLLNSTAKLFVNTNNDGVKRILKENHRNLIECSAKQLDKYKTNNHLVSLAPFNQNVALAANIAKDLGVADSDISKLLDSLSSETRRFNIARNNEITIIDDSYNINPDSARAGVEFLIKQPGRKIIVTGGIVDQGENEEDANFEYGKLLGQHIDIIIIANNILIDLINGGIQSVNPDAKVIISSSPSETPAIIRQTIKAGDTILIQNELPDTYWS